MESSLAAKRITRRLFAKLAGVALGSGVTILRLHGRRASALPSAQRRVYLFDPSAESVACKACLRHAVSKRFASGEAAESGRAHPGCRCAIRAVPVSDAEFLALFGRPGSAEFRSVRDLRAALPVRTAPGAATGGLEMPAAPTM